jgi:multicomponent Na+:H+ antiporter subunit D
MATAGKYDFDPADALQTVPLEFSDYYLVFPVALPLFFGAVCLAFYGHRKLQYLLGYVTFITLCFTNFSLLLDILDNGPASMVMGQWLPPFGIAFTADAMGALFALTTSVIALLVFIYSMKEIDEETQARGFVPLYLILISGVSGAFLTGDIFNLYVWFEVLLISSFGLIVLGGRPVQIDGAVKYAVLNLVATTIFLIAVAYVYGLFGTLNMADIIRKIPFVPSEAPLFTIVLLFIVAFAMKAAAFPLNFWLPASYHTPNILVSAIFAGLLTKVGVYALLRIATMLFSDAYGTVYPFMLTIGVFTAVLGALGTLAQSDIRKALNYTVISGVGIMLIGIGIGSETAYSATIMYAVHSMIVMTALYIMAGQIGRIGQTFSMNAIAGKGLFSTYSKFSVLFFLLVLAVSGLPPLSGFWPKAMLIQASLAEDLPWATYSIIASSFVTLIAFGRIWSFFFWNSESNKPSAVDVEGLSKRVVIPLSAFVAITFLIGIYLEPLASISQAAAQSIVQPEAYVNSVFGVPE